MEMKQLINLSLTLSFIGLVFFPTGDVIAKTESHHVVLKQEKTTENKTTSKTDDKKETTEPSAKEKNKSIPRNHPTEIKKSSKETKGISLKIEKPLVMETQKTIANKLPDFMKEWMKYLNQDCKGSCTLTYADALKLIEDTHITGQQAAVLGSIVTQMNNANSSNPQYSLKELQKMYKANDSIYSWYYIVALQNINGVRALSGAQNKLFGPSGTLSSSTQIVQNALGDCFVLSAINGLLNVPGGPAKLQSMISRVSGTSDEFLVSLPGYPKNIFVKLTETKLAMYSTLSQGGEWLAVLSDAESKARRLNPESGIFNGGYQTQTLHLLTGKDYENKALSPFTHEQVEIVKGLSKEQWLALENLSSAQLITLSTLTPQQLKDYLTRDELKAFEEIPMHQLIELQKLSSAQWNELATLIFNNSGNVDLKLLKTFKPASQEKLTKQIEADLNEALNQSNPPKIVGIETNVHDLTVLAYNSQTQTLTIKNPWGVSGWYNPVTADGPDSAMPKKGTTPPWFDMKLGVFQVQISQLIESNFITMTMPKAIVKETATMNKKLKPNVVAPAEPQVNLDTQSMQSAVDTAKNMSNEKVKVLIDEAQKSIDKVLVYEEEAKATRSMCQQPGANAICQNKLKTISDNLIREKAKAQSDINKISDVINKK